MDIQILKNGFVLVQQLGFRWFVKTQRSRVLFYQGGIVRVTHTLADDFSEKPCDFVLPQQAADCTVTKTETGYIAVGDGVTVKVTEPGGNLSFYDNNGKLLLDAPHTPGTVLDKKDVVLHEYKDEQVTYEDSVDGLRARTKEGRAYVDRVGVTGRQNFRFAEDEGIYGLGSHEEGYGNLRGKHRVLFQHNMKACVPAIVSTKGWEIVLALGGLTSFHDDAEGSYLWCECADEFDFYFLYGDGSYESVMQRYITLTGKTPMLPRSALGYVQSKERYVDAREILEVAKEYRRRNVPLDVMVLDWQSWPENQWGYKVFDESRFPDTKKWTDELHDLHTKLMISIWPSMNGDQNENRKEMLEKGLMLGNKTIYNAFLPEARETYWRQANDGLFSKGVDSWWCDCSEPFEADWHGAVKMEEHERVTANTDEARKYFDPTMLSAYSFYHSKGIYEGQRGTSEEKRVLNLTRSSYIGQHRFATVSWSGDISATWEVLRRQVPEGMNFCATGEPFWTTDAGAFFTRGGVGAWFGAGDFNDGVDDLGYRELYTRWLQFGACLPMMRSHGTGTPREIWRFGEKGTMFYDAIEKIIDFRYRLFPYFYSMMAKTHERGVSPLRVPALCFPRDAYLTRIDDEMMVGDSILVKPVTFPMYYQPYSAPIDSKDHYVSVYLPAGCDWYDWEKGAKYAGGQTISYDAPIDVLPAFIKGGTILPTVPVCQHTDDAARADLKLTVYPGADASFTLYEDAGDGYGYEQGECAHTTFLWNDQEKVLTVMPREGAFPGMEKERKLTVSLPGGKEVALTFGGNAQAVRISL